MNEHPFDNGGAVSGNCRICGGPVTEHKTFLSSEGVKPLIFPTSLEGRKPFHAVEAQGEKSA